MSSPRTSLSRPSPRKRRRIYVVTLAAVLTGAVLAGHAQQPTPPSSSDFTFALVGDSIITRKISVYSEPAFTRVIDLIRNADAAFANLEMLFHDYEPYASAASGGTYMRAAPAL